MRDVNRRDFLRSTAFATAAIGLTGTSAGPDGDPSAEGESEARLATYIDVNVALGHWPFRRLPADDPAVLANVLRENDIEAAWAGSFEGILHKDIAAVNERLAETCYRHELFVPFGTINPAMHGWERNLQDAQEQYGMPGIRLYPNYHQYALDDPRARALLGEAADRGLIVQIAVVMEDARTQHPLVRVPAVDLQPLSDVLNDLPDLNVVILNYRNEVPVAVVQSLAATGQVYFDMARAEGMGPIERLLESVPAERVLFGSHAPFFYHIAAKLKMKESVLSEDQTAAISRQNAAELLPTVSR